MIFSLRKLHAALMPDYNRAATLYWWLMVLAGAATLTAAALVAASHPLPVQLQILAACIASMVAGAFPVKLPGTKSSFAAAEIFVFLALLSVGVEAACLAAAAEAFLASARTSKRWTSRLISPAVAAVAIGVVGSAFVWLSRALQSSGWYGDAILVLVASAAAAPYFFLTSWLVRLVLHFKTREPLKFSGLVLQFGWIAATYTLSALIAALLYLTVRHGGPGVLFAAVPVIALLITTMHFHFRQREAEAAAIQARVEAAEREATLTAKHNIELKHIADHDALTQLVNRRHFVECLNEVYMNRGRSGSDFAVMFLDFDRFKHINDTLGHDGGDEFLVHVSNRIANRVRPSDLVARLGGDEFAVLMTDLEDELQAIDTAERLLDTLRQPYDISGNPVTSSASIGITFSKFGYASAGDMLRDADRAMYYAKSLGGARYIVHRPPKPSKATDRGGRQREHA